jgi:hypothetical protein
MRPPRGDERRPVNPIGWGFGMAWDRAGHAESVRTPAQLWARGFGMSRDMPRDERAGKRLG